MYAQTAFLSYTQAQLEQSRDEGYAAGVVNIGIIFPPQKLVTICNPYAL